MRCRRPLIPSSMVAIAAGSILVAGCGGGLAATAATTSQHRLLAYSNCMRSNGLPDFPDPAGSGGIPKREIPVGSPQFGVAQSACQHLMPASGLGPHATAPQAQHRVADELAFARCIRNHGLPNFPDPTSSGQLTHEMVANAGINPKQPAVRQAADACVSVTDGAITKATVARFIAGH